MNSAMAGDSSRPPEGYSNLPEGVKQVVSEIEYLWLSDTEKARLEQELTEPEWW